MRRRGGRKHTSIAAGGVSIGNNNNTLRGCPLPAEVSAEGAAIQQLDRLRHFLRIAQTPQGTTSAAVATAAATTNTTVDAGH